MPELKKSTRYLKVHLIPLPNMKKFFRRGGERFDRNPRLVDVQKIGDDNAIKILAAAALDVVQMTKAAGDKEHKLLRSPEPADKSDAKAVELEAQVREWRQRFNAEKKQRADLERQFSDLMDEATTREEAHDKLRKQYEELVDAADREEPAAQAEDQDDGDDLEDEE